MVLMHYPLHMASPKIRSPEPSLQKHRPAKSTVREADGGKTQGVSVSSSAHTQPATGRSLNTDSKSMLPTYSFYPFCPSSQPLGPLSCQHQIFGSDLDHGKSSAHSIHLALDSLPQLCGAGVSSWFRFCTQCHPPREPFLGPL